MARSRRRTWNAEEVVAALRAASDPQIATIFMRRNPLATAWGVRFGDMGKLLKQIESDAALAAELWQQPAFEPRYMALQVMPKGSLTEEQADTWVLDLDFPILSDEFAKAVFHTPWAGERAFRWIDDEGDYVQRTGWSLLYGFAADPESAIGDEQWLDLLERIAESIHKAPNWSREAMNNLPIAIGLRNPNLLRAAVAAAEHYGKVSVFHGDKTNCKVNDAVALLGNPRTRVVQY